MHIVEFDCLTGQPSQRPMTDDELAFRDNIPEEIATAERHRSSLLSVVRKKAADDPAFAALVELLGVGEA